MKSVFYPLRLMALRLFLAAAVFGCAAAIERKPPSQAPSLQEIEEYAEFVLEGGEFSEEIFSMLAEKYFLEYAAMEKDEKGGEPPGHARFISTVKKLSGKHPVDKLSYAAGYALFESGMTSEATTEFESFLRDYPRSPYRSEVAFRLGEIYFDREKDKEAIERYALVLSEPGSQFFGGALYKTGWAWHRLDEFRKAFGYFVRLSDSAGEAVRKEAVANIVMTLGRMEGKERNSALSEIKDRDYAPHAALTLGALLNDQTRPEEALDA
jgi:tetratricopeptide (TPR) repeat protein